MSGFAAERDFRRLQISISPELLSLPQSRWRAERNQFRVQR